MRTITIKKTTGGKFAPGWKEVEITKAVYGDYNGAKYIDCYFKDYPDSLNLRIYEKVGQISEVLSGADGENVVKIDDSASSLMGKKVNIFMYKDGEYSRVLSSVAPTMFENQLESFKENDVEYWKSNAENYYQKYVVTKIASSDNTSKENTSDAEMPF